jgi:hypothetical protein
MGAASAQRFGWRWSDTWRVRFLGGGKAITLAGGGVCRVGAQSMNLLGRPIDAAPTPPQVAPPQRPQPAPNPAGLVETGGRPPAPPPKPFPNKGPLSLKGQTDHQAARAPLPTPQPSHKEPPPAPTSSHME